MVLAMTLLILIIGGTGCMNSGDQVVQYVEEKYNQEFEVETVKEGSKFLADLYGKDKVVLHPKGNADIVFVAQEHSKKKNVFFDNYVAARWGEELKAELAPQIEQHIPADSEYKVLVYINSTKFDDSMINMSLQEFMGEVDNNVRVVLDVGIKTAGEPDVSEYSEGITNLYDLVKNLGTAQYTVSVGFVDASEDISEYIRTAYVNNIPWTNLDAKVYGDVNIDDRYESVSPEDVVENYQPIGG